MAIAWFIAKYKRRVGARHPTVYVPVDDYTDLVRADGGDWREVEVLGGYAIVKVDASDTTLTTIAGDPSIVRVPLSRLDDPLSSLTAGQRTTIRNTILNMGYTTTEINNAFPNLANATLGQVLRFAATRRQDPTYDSGTDTVSWTGAVESCGSIDDLDAAVQ